MNDKTSVVWNEPNKQIILNCSDRLWELLQKYRKSNLKEMDLLTLAKVYKEIKSLDLSLSETKDINLNEKENENAENKS